MRQRQFMFAVMALLLMFAACKGESPTAPNTTPVTTTSPTTPPSGASVTLTVSNASPLVSSTSVVTATVTLNGSPVPNGTAVQFTTNLGSFTDTGASGSSVIKTTTNGIATATLTSGSAGPAVVTAVVNNVSKSTTITFGATSPIPTPPSTTPTVVSITPATGRPEGGETITITGTNFRNPVRVIFKCEGSAATPPDPSACNGQSTKDALVTNVTPTQITAITPAFNVTAGQAVTFTITVLSGAGSTSEGSIVTSGAFTFTSPSLTPKITTLLPVSGPLEGGTRVSIRGSGFQAPVQVTFGISGGAGAPLIQQVEAQVISVNFTEVVIMTPEYRLIDPDLSQNNPQVAIRVVNVNSGTDAVQLNAFRYLPRLTIVAISPTSGTAIGGGQIRIDGIGFDDPVAVSVAGVPAQPIRVSGTELIVRLGSTPSPCSGASGPVVVTNINTGDTASSTQSFTYIPVNPEIASVVPTTGIVPGSSISVDVTNPGVGQLGSAVVAFDVGGTAVSPTPGTITNGIGLQTFNVVVPTTGFTFPQIACTTAGGLTGTQFGPVTATLGFRNTTTGCSATLAGGIIVNPPAPNNCVVPPPTATVTVPANGACANAGDIVAAGAITGSSTITIQNAPGAQPLTISSIVVQGASGGTITVGPPAPLTLPGGTARSFTVTVDPTCVPVGGPPASCPVTGNIVFTTNDPLNPTVTVCVTANGT